MTTHIGALLRTEVRLQRRHGVIAATVGVTVLWIAVLRALPPSLRQPVLPWLLFLEVSAAGFFFIPALAVVERANGVTAALRLTQLSPATALAVRLGVVTGLATVVATVVAAAAGAAATAGLFGGVVLTTLLFSLTALLMVGRADSLTTYLARAPLVAAPLLAPALLFGTGLVDSPLLRLSPATAAFQLLSGRTAMPAASAAWVVAWLVVLATFAVRIGFDVNPTPTAASRAHHRSHLGVLRPPGRRAAVQSLATVDWRTLSSERLLLLLVAGVPLIALALRWFRGAGATWMLDRYGVDIGPHLPAVHAFVLTMHVPAIFGSIGGLLFVEDRDAGLLPTLSVTPAGTATLAAYRLTATAAVAAVGVAASMAVAGVAHPAGPAGVVLTALAGGAVATVPAAMLARFARDRVHGMALMKVITLPLYLPTAWWFVSGPMGWTFLALPTGWAARAFWASDAGAAAMFAAGAVMFSLGLARLLLHGRLQA